MKKLMAVILSLMLVAALVCGVVSAESILPSAQEVRGAWLPSVGEALGRYPDSETVGEDGSTTELYTGVSDEEYELFGVYLGEQGADIGEYHMEYGVLTAEIRAGDASFWMVYTPAKQEIRATYPAGTQAKKAKMSVKVGGTVKFGRYPQTEEGTDETPIEWIVLEVDEENHRALLLSKYGLDDIQYSAEGGIVTWEACTLRSWLNQDFLSRAFSHEEQDAILQTDVDNSDAQGFSGWDTTGGNNTQDKIFLLSYAEANRYLNITRSNGKNMASRVEPTAYAIKQGASISSDIKAADGSAAGYWWLRSPGDNQYSAAFVNYDGSLSYFNGYCEFVCVRPALWINLESDIF